MRAITVWALALLYNPEKNRTIEMKENSLNLKVVNIIFIAVKIGIYFLTGYIFAHFWAAMLSSSGPFQHVFPYSYALTLFWFLLDMAMYERFYKITEGVIPIKNSLVFFVSFLAAYPLFLVWDSLLWTYYLNVGGFLYNFTISFCVMPIFYMLQCLSMAAIFFCISMIQLLVIKLKLLTLSTIEQPYRSESGEIDSENNSLKILTATSGGNTYYIKTDEVVRIEANRYYARLILEDNDHLVRESMDSLSERLEPLGFRRIHRSHIINVAYMEKIVKTSTKSISYAVMKNDDKVPIARSKLSAFRSDILHDLEDVAASRNELQ